MAASAYRLPSPYEDVPLRRRASGVVLALGLNLLLLFLLLGISHRQAAAPPPSGMTIIGLDSDKPAAPEQRQQSAKPQQRVPSHLEPPPIVLPVKPTIQPPPKLDLLELSREELTTTDRALASAAAPSAAAGGGHHGEDTPVVGHGPNGETLYAAEWLREPTNQELSTYMPAGSPEGVGVIACKTYPNFRVDDCVEIESRPASSHLARAVRNAAWQFKVRPPRKNGAPMIGEWVTIRVTYSRSAGG